MDKNRSIGFLNGAIHRGAHRYFEKELAELHLHRGMINALKRLYNNDGISQQELSISMLVDKSNVARIISRMEEMELIRRSNDPADGRSKIVNLTQKAWTLQPFLQNVFSGWSEILTCDMTEAEIEMLRHLLRKCIENMNKYFAQKGAADESA